MSAMLEARAEAATDAAAASVLLPPNGTVVEITSPTPIESLDDTNLPEGTTVVIVTVEASEELGAPRTKVAYVLDEGIMMPASELAEEEVASQEREDQRDSERAGKEVSFAVTVPTDAGFFSAAEMAIGNLKSDRWGGVNAAEQLKAEVKKAGVPDAELEWIGWRDIVAELIAERAPGRPILKKDVLAKIQANRVEIMDVQFSGDDLQYGDWMYDRHWRTAGRQDRVEIALLMKGFDEGPVARSHFEEDIDDKPQSKGIEGRTPGMVGWARVSVITDPDGTRRLHLEEVQTDRAQELEGTPYAGGKWQTLILKRVLMYAAEHGFTEMSWPTGAEQISRNYGPEALREYQRLVTGYYYHGGNTHPSDIRAKDLAVELEGDAAGNVRPYFLERFYDQILPRLARTLGRKHEKATPAKWVGRHKGHLDKDDSLETVSVTLDGESRDVALDLQVFLKGKQEDGTYREVLWLEPGGGWGNRSMGDIDLRTHSVETAREEAAQGLGNPESRTKEGVLAHVVKQWDELVAAGPLDDGELYAFSDAAERLNGDVRAAAHGDAQTLGHERSIAMEHRMPIKQSMHKGFSSASSSYALTESVQDMNIARAAQGLRPLYPSDRRFGGNAFALTGSSDQQGPATALLAPGADPRQSLVFINKHLADMDKFLFQRDSISKQHGVTLKEAMPAGLTPRQQDKWQRDHDAAMLLYIDTLNATRLMRDGKPIYGSAREVYNKYQAGLSEEQKRLWELSQTLPHEVKVLAEAIIRENDALGTIALRNGIIENKHEVYAARLWFRKGRSAEGGLLDPTRAGGPLRTKPAGRQMRRVYDSILAGQALGETLRVPSAIEAQRVAARQVGEAVYNLALIKTLKDKSIIATRDEVGQDRSWISLKAMQFQGYVAPKEIAKTLNAITETIDYDNLGAFMSHLLQVNSWAKQTILTFSFFHHQAFMRSSIVTMDRPALMNNLAHIPSMGIAALKTAGYALGFITQESVEASARNMPAYNAGRQAILSQAAELIELVRAGLTVGSAQDLSPMVNSDLTDFRKKLDGVLAKMPGGKGTMKGYDHFVETQRRATHWLFNNMGANLKVQGAMIEYAHLKRKYAKELAMPWDESNPLWSGEGDASAQEHLARLAAEKLNADFGGLNLRRTTGKVTKGARHARHQMWLRVAFLAPDWTESNLITATKAIRAGGKAEKDVYRAMWANVATRFVATTMLWNFMMAGFDWDEWLEDTQRAAAAGEDSVWDGLYKMYWMDMNIQPIANMFNKHLGEKGAQTGSDKYFSLMGHFRDPLKWTLSVPYGDRGIKASIKGKLSPAATSFYNAWHGEDWAGRSYTNVSELTGVSFMGYEPDPEKRGKFNTWAPTSGSGAMTPQRLPSYVLERITSVAPIQLEAGLRFAQGQIDALDFMGKLVGLAVHRTYPDKE